MNRMLCFSLVLVVCAGSARGDPYWIAYEGDVFPEDAGWERIWGDWDGQFHGDGAIRTLEDGILTYDTTFDLGVYEFSRMERPGAIDPGPGEVFVVEWRLKVSDVTGTADAGVFVASDDAWVLSMRFAEDHIVSGFEGLLEIPFEPGTFHDYRIESHDMRTYDLYIDGILARKGNFAPRFSDSEFGWGPGTQGASSMQRWDYIRFGVLPEPPGVSLILFVLACHGGKRAFTR